MDLDEARPSDDSGKPEPFRLAHYPALDGLRGIAVLLVIGYHAGFSWLRGGFLGVDIFFVLSGFLITALLMEEWERTGSVDLPNFYARRALRLMPALFAFLGIFVLFPRLFVPDHIQPWKLAAIVLLQAANWASALQFEYLHVLVPTWSLAVEEQFYLLWPPLLVLLLGLRLRPAWIIGLVIIGIDGAAALRVLLWEPGRAGFSRVAFGTDTRMDALLLGCLIGLLAAWRLLPARAWMLSLIRLAMGPAAVLLAVLVWKSRDNSAWTFHGVGLAADAAVGIILIGLLTGPPHLARVTLEHPALGWIGRRSYALYLWHFPIFFGLLGGPWVAGMRPDELTFLRLATTFAVAAASFHFVELPMLRLKRYFRGGAPRPVRTVPKIQWGGSAGPAPSM